MGLGLGLGAAGILWVADQLSLDRQRTQLEGLVGLSADRVAETIHRAAHDGMLRNDADGVRRMIENIGAQEGVDRVRIYNKEGRVRVSSTPAEEGTLVDKRSDECIACHAGAQPKAGLDRKDRIRMLQQPGRGRVLGIITPIYNEPKCTACHVHPASQRVLGILDVRLSMGQADRALATSERQMQYGLFATGLAVLLAELPDALGPRPAAGQDGCGRPWSAPGRATSRCACPCARRTRWESSPAPGTT